jgi:hypothetical protein
VDGVAKKSGGVCTAAVLEEVARSQEPVARMCSPKDEINDCSSLFLDEIVELDHQRLRLVISEGLPDGNPVSLKIGGTTISGATRIEVTAESRVFELIWTTYVGYSVRNESYAQPSEDEVYEGNRLRIYSKSPFIDYISRATLACDEYPGPTRHYELVCENHIVDIVSV